MYCGTALERHRAIDFLESFESTLALNDVSLTSTEALTWFILCLRQEAKTWWVTSVQQSHEAQLTQWKVTLGDIISRAPRSSLSSLSGASVQSTAMQLQVKSLVDKISSSPLESYLSARILFIAQYGLPYDNTIMKSCSTSYSIPEERTPQLQDQKCESLYSSSATSSLVNSPSNSHGDTLVPVSPVSTNNVTIITTHTESLPLPSMGTSESITTPPQEAVMHYQAKESVQLNPHQGPLDSTVHFKDVPRPMGNTAGEDSLIPFADQHNFAVPVHPEGTILVDGVRRVHDRGRTSAATVTVFIAEFEDRESSRQRPGPKHNNGVFVRRSSRNIVC